MRRAEGVVGRFDAPRKAGDAALHAQLRHGVAPAGEDLVGVGLVADVPDDAVLRRIEHRVQRDRQLDGAEVGREMPPGLRHGFEHEGAQLVGQLLELAAIERAQSGRVVDRASYNFV